MAEGGLIPRYRRFAVAVALLLGGCYAPLRSPGTPANTLPDSFRIPQRSVAPTLNYAALVAPRPAQYSLGPGDTLDVTVPGLFSEAERQTFRVQVMDSGAVHLPELGPVQVGGLSLEGAEQAINRAYANGVLDRPHANILLVQKATLDVLVLGEVAKPGVYSLPRFQTDVGHALAMAGGLTQTADNLIQVHRFSWDMPCALNDRRDTPRGDVQLASWHAPSGNYQSAPQRLPLTAPGLLPTAFPGQSSAQDWSSFRQPSRLPNEWPGTRQGYVANRAPPPFETSIGTASEYPPPAERATASGPGSLGMPQSGGSASADCPTHPLGNAVIEIPLRADRPTALELSTVMLRPGDVVVVPRRRREVFYVVGELSDTSRTQFTVGETEREIGSGFLLPRDRDIDVVTAVAMAGYIDPIDSPTTVTVHRVLPTGQPMLIRVDLFKARYDRMETILVQPGDIIYLNPDPAWWFRRTFDRVLPDLISLPLIKALGINR